jgi:hypothetical protein
MRRLVIALVGEFFQIYTGKLFADINLGFLDEFGLQPGRWQRHCT